MRKKYPAKKFLRRFPDVAVREAVRRAYPGIDFSKNSGDMLDADSVTEMRIEDVFVGSLAGLEVFSNMRLFCLNNSYEGRNDPETFKKDQTMVRRIPDCWVKLEELTLSGNLSGKLELPDAMPALKHLSLCRHSFSSCSANLPEFMPEIESMDLESVYWDSDRVIGRWPKLVSVHWYHCVGERVEMAHLPKLQTLEIVAPALSELILYDLPALEVVCAFFSSLEVLRLPGDDDSQDASAPIDETMPARNSSIRVLNVESNDFSALTLPAFMPELTTLDASNNRLSHISLPHPLPADVRLPQNRLTSFTLQGPEPFLEHLDLSRNRLRELSLPSELPRLEALLLQHNPVAALPKMDAPKLSRLDISYSDILSWKDVQLSHPGALRHFVAQINNPADISEIDAAYPGLIDFSPFIESDMNLQDLFGRWDYTFDYEDDRSDSFKQVYVPSIELKVATSPDGKSGELMLALPLRQLPGMKGFLKRCYALRSASPSMYIDQRSRACVIEYLNEESLENLPSYCTCKSRDVEIHIVERYRCDRVVYRAKAYGIEPEYSPDGRRLFEAERLEVVDGQLRLTFRDVMGSYVRGQVEAFGRIFEAVDARWQVEQREDGHDPTDRRYNAYGRLRASNGWDKCQACWDLPKGWEQMEQSCVVSGFYNQHWVKVAKERLEI